MTTRIEARLDELAERCVEASPRLSPEERRIVLGTFRVMARDGAAVRAQVAAAAGATEDSVERALRSWPGVYRNEAGAVIGFWGLSIQPMRHRIRIEGRMLYGWCAWDTLFLPALIGSEARVESTCPATAAPVTLTVGPDGVRDLEPAAARVSFLEPDAEQVKCGRVISSFCEHIHFLASRDAGEAWLAANRHATRLLTVDEAWELGRLVTRLRFGELADADRAGRTGGRS